MPEPLLNRRRPNCKDWAHPIPPCRLAIQRMRRSVLSPLFGNCRYSHKCKERPSGTLPRNISLCWALGGTRLCWLRIDHLALWHPWHKGQRRRRCIVAESPRFVGKMGQHGRPPALECLSEAGSIAMLIRRNSLGSVALSDPSARRLKVTIGRDGGGSPRACGLASLPVPSGKPRNSRSGPCSSVHAEERNGNQAAKLFGRRRSPKLASVARLTSEVEMVELTLHVSVPLILVVVAITSYFRRGKQA